MPIAPFHDRDIGASSSTREVSAAADTSVVDRSLDVGIAIASAVPAGALSAALLAVLGKGGLIVDHWHKSVAAEREQQQFEQVIWQAALALADGDADVAAANLAAHADDPAFRARVHATVQRMREAVPCTEAIAPLGLLIAVYGGRRVDPLYRNTVAMLCDADAETLRGVEEVIRVLSSASWGYGYFNVGSTRDRQTPAPRYYLAFPAKEGRPLIPVSSRDCLYAESALVEHQLGTQGQVDPGFGSSGELVGFTGLDGTVFALLKKVLGLVPREK